MTSPSTSAATSNAAIAAQRSSLSAQRTAQREQKLRSDPLVEVHGPVDVTCRRCGTHIKLSTKSSYDPFHWHRHIERCSKRPTKVVKQIKEQGKGTDAVRFVLFAVVAVLLSFFVLLAYGFLSPSPSRSSPLSILLSPVFYTLHISSHRKNAHRCKKVQ